MFHLRPCPRLGAPARPRLGERIRDLERLIRQAQAVLAAPVDPASYPDGVGGHITDAAFEVVGFQFDAALRELGRIADLSPPPVGSAVPVGKPPAAGR
jgi:hypothetical protein